MNNISRAFPLYSIAFAIIYVTAVNYNLTPFTYHSRLGMWEWFAQPQKTGPAMYWYGWVVASTICAAIAAAMSLAMTWLLSRLPSIWPPLALMVVAISIVMFVGWYWYEWKWDLAIGIPVAVAVLLALPSMPGRLASSLVWLIPISMLLLQIYIVRDYFLKS